MHVVTLLLFKVDRYSEHVTRKFCCVLSSLEYPPLMDSLLEHSGHYTYRHISLKVSAVYARKLFKCFIQFLE